MIYAVRRAAAQLIVCLCNKDLPMGPNPLCEMFSIKQMVSPALRYENVFDMH